MPGNKYNSCSFKVKILDDFKNGIVQKDLSVYTTIYRTDPDQQQYEKIEKLNNFLLNTLKQFIEKPGMKSQ